MRSLCSAAFLLGMVLILLFFFPLSDASECQAGNFGGSIGANGHWISAWWIWLPEERRRDVEGRRLCQQGGAGGGHTGKTVPKNENVNLSRNCLN